MSTISAVIAAIVVVILFCVAIIWSAKAAAGVALFILMALIFLGAIAAFALLNWLRRKAN